MGNIYAQSSVWRIGLGLLAAVVAAEATMVVVVIAIISSGSILPEAPAVLLLITIAILHGVWVLILLSLVIAVPTALFGGTVLTSVFCKRGWTKLWQAICGGAFLGFLVDLMVFVLLPELTEPTAERSFVDVLSSFSLVFSGAVGGAAFWFVVFRRIVDPGSANSQPLG